MQPRGLTPIAHKLDVLVGDYVEKLERASRRKRKGDLLAIQQIKPVNFIVITDGAPSKPLICVLYDRVRQLCVSGDEPVDSIVALARRLDRGNYPLAQVSEIIEGENVTATNFGLKKIGIQFVQIGNDKEATEFLRQLDDDLSGTYGVRVS